MNKFLSVIFILLTVGIGNAQEIERYNNITDFIKFYGFRVTARDENNLITEAYVYFNDEMQNRIASLRLDLFSYTDKFNKIAAEYNDPFVSYDRKIELHDEWNSLLGQHAAKINELNIIYSDYEKASKEFLDLRIGTDF